MKYSIRVWLLSALLGLCIIIFFGQDWSVVGLVTRFTVLTICAKGFKLLIFRRVSLDCRYANGEVVVVTGASCGIGAQTASFLASRGGKVIWAARDTNKAQSKLNDIRWTRNHGPRGYVMKLDLAAKETIQQFVSTFKSRENALNALILNAAYIGPRRLTADGFEQNVGVNHLGHMYLVYLFLDMLKQSAPSRVVVLSSDLHRYVKKLALDDMMLERDYTPIAAYNTSKLMNILFARELARRLKGMGITVYAVHPGTPIKSELMRDTWLGSFLFNHLILPPLCWTFCRSTYEGAQTPAYCAVSPECADETGEYYENLRKDTPSELARDDLLASKLWDISCDMLKIPRDWA